MGTLNIMLLLYGDLGEPRVGIGEPQKTARDNVTQGTDA